MTIKATDDAGNTATKDDAGNTATKDDTDATLGSSLRLQVKEKTAPVITVTAPMGH